jgi:hypothetical protein
MVRIGGGVFPEIKEPNYLGADGACRNACWMGRLCARGFRSFRLSICSVLHQLSVISGSIINLGARV